MSKPEAPCKDCNERHPHCHSECVKYKEYKDEQVRDKEAYYKNADNAYDRYKQMKIKKGKK